MDAFKTFVQQNETSLYSLCYCLLDDAAAAEDVAQRVLVESYPHFAAMTAHELLGSACRCCLVRLPGDFAHHRHSCRHDALSSEGKLQSVLDQLRPESRAILLLHDRFGFHYEEIAAVLAMEAGHVRQRLYEARHEAAATLLQGSPTDENGQLLYMDKTRAWFSNGKTDKAVIPADTQIIRY
jgi:RNA polymerase sigma-70 factor (ECF subfamily)